MLDGVAWALEVNPGKYVGTFDLTRAILKATSDATRQALNGYMVALGPKAGSMSFEAALDEQGRFVRLQYSFRTNSGELRTEITFTDYGTPIAVTPPSTADVDEATEDMYEGLREGLPPFGD